MTICVVIIYSQDGGGVVITHNVSTKPDKVQVISGKLRNISEASPNMLNYDNNAHGDFYFGDNDKELSYLGKTIHTIVVAVNLCQWEKQPLT